jgi:hypothetical protein
MSSFIEENKVLLLLKCMIGNPCCWSDITICILW